jgi:hypothetical protein
MGVRGAIIPTQLPDPTKSSTQDSTKLQVLDKLHAKAPKEWFTLFSFFWLAL